MTDTLVVPQPWLNEDDWEFFMYSNVPCAVVRNTDFGGHLCGYIAVPVDHPWFLMDPSVPNCTTAHKGITCRKLSRVENPESLTLGPEFAVLGFDCGHALDYQPLLGGPNPENYRTFDYVRQTVKKMAIEAKTVQRFKFKQNVLSRWG